MRRKVFTPGQVGEIKARTAKEEVKKTLAQEYGISRQTLYASLDG